MVIHNAAITGSLTLNGIDISDITGSEAGVNALNDFSSSILNYTSSTDARLTALNVQTSSLLSYTASNDAKITALNAQTASILSYTSSNDAKIAAIYTATSSLNESVSALNLQTASLLSYTSSNTMNVVTLFAASASLNANVAGLNAQTASLLSYTSSNSANVVTLFATSASLNASVAGLNAQSASLLSYTASNSANVSSLFASVSSLSAGSASSAASINALNAQTASLLSYTASNSANIVTLFTTSASLNASVASLNTYTSSLNAKTASFATTGSNTFTGQQYISNASQANSFTQTASLYTDGGMRVTKDMYVSGTAYFNNITVFGTQSVAFISSSQLNIATNIISVNTSTPSIRFGGLAVQDSGSGATGLTGSILWDSQDNQWIYSNPSGSAYDSAVFLVGPRSSGALGNEVGITTNALSKGDGLHHMTSSGVFEVSGSVGIGTSVPAYRLDVAGEARITGSVIGNQFSVASIVGGGFGTTALSNTQNVTAGAVIGTYLNTFAFIDLATQAGNGSWIDFSSGSGDDYQGRIRYNNSLQSMYFYTNANSTPLVSYTSANVGIGTTSPDGKLDIQASSTGTVLTRLWNTDTSGTGASALRIANSGNNNNGGRIEFSDAAYYVATIAGDRTQGLTFRTSATGGSPTGISIRMIILPDGNVGIGTTSPTAPLTFQTAGDTVDGTYFSSFTLRNTGASSISRIRFDRSSSAKWGLTLFPNNSFRISNLDLNGTGVADDTAITILNSSNVGIGTASPGSKLDVAGSLTVGTGVTGANTDIKILNATNSTTHYIFSDQSSGELGIESGTSAGIKFNTNTFNTRMVITSGGNVGIGTTSPTTRLHVSGTVGGVFEVDGAAAVNALYVSASGFVGIGTASPGYRLDINGGATDTTLAVQTTGQNAVRLRLTNEERSFILTNNPGDDLLSFNYDGNNRFQFNTTNQWFNSGNVGIGTTSPTYLLDVSGTGRFTGNVLISKSNDATVEVNSTTAASYSAFFHSESGTAKAYWEYVNSTFSDSTRRNYLEAFNSVGGFSIYTAGGKRLDINTSGAATFSSSVTTSGGGFVANMGSTNTEGLIIQRANTSSNAIIKFRNNTTDTWILGNRNTGDETFRLYNYNLGSDVLTVTNSGNVGIGTTSPGYKLDVNAASTSDGLRVQNAGTSKIIANGDGVLLWGAAADYGALTWDTGFARVNAFGSLDLRLTTSAGGLITLKSGGNVGIGTTSPQYRLHVQDSTNVGTIALGHNLYPGLIYSDAGSGEFRIDNRSSSSGYISFYPNGQTTVGNERMRITSGGNIGINTTFSGINTAALLTIKAAGSDGNQIYIVQSNDDRGWRLKARTDGHFYLQSSYLGSDTTNFMIKYDDGNVGIGTTSPLARLEVDVAPASNTGILFLDMSDGSGGAIVLGVGQSVGPYIVGNTFPNGNVRGAYGGSRMAFNSGGFQFDYSSTTSGARSWSTYMSITSGGSVGIGTTGPAYTLDVTGTGRFTSTLNVNDRLVQGTGGQRSTSGTTIALTNNTTFSANSDIGDDRRFLSIVNESTTTSAFSNICFRNSPNSSTTMLDMKFVNNGSSNSTLYWTFNSAGGFNDRLTLTSAGTLTAAGDVVAFSDARLKENVITVDNAVEKVLAMRGVFYNKKEDETKSRKVGVIAQEIQEILPEVVTSSADGTLGVAYGNIVGVLIEAIKELNAKIDRLENK